MSKNTWNSKQASAKASASNKAVLYLRVSGEEQAKHGNGIDAQLDACTVYATQHGYEIVGVYRDEAVKGDSNVSERQGLQGALTSLAMNEASVLVTAAQDRLARDGSIWYAIRAAAIRGQWAIETVKEGNLTKVGSEFMGDIYAAVAAQEKRTITARLVGGRRERSRRDGRGSGFLPYGYKLITQETIAIDEQEAEIVRAILLRRDGGDTFQTIADKLNLQGYVTAHGGQWSRGLVKIVDDKRELYTTGVKTWGDVSSQEKWPIILTPRLSYPA
jgi:site-specific DNA recombinase